MASVNKVFVLGNLGKDPVVRHTSSGTAVCSFSVATQDSWNDKQGNRQERVEWVRVSVWGKQAELCGQHLSRGRQVFLEGRLKTSTVEKNGQNVYYTEVVAQNVQFVGKKDSGQGAPDYGHPPPSTHEYVDENVPF